MKTVEVSTGSEKAEAIIFEEIPRRWGWLLALGILMLVGGTLGMVATFAFTLAGVMLFAAILLVGGVLQLAHGFMDKETRWLGRPGTIAMALLYLFMGGLVLWDPLAASLGLTLAIAALFAAMGAFRLVEAWRRRKRGWRWGLTASVGLLEIAFCAVVTLQWPISGLWVIGVLIAVEFLLNGWLLIFAALATRRLANNEPEDSED